MTNNAQQHSCGTMPMSWQFESVCEVFGAERSRHCLPGLVKHGGLMTTMIFVDACKDPLSDQLFEVNLSKAANEAAGDESHSVLIIFQLADQLTLPPSCR